MNQVTSEESLHKKPGPKSLPPYSPEIEAHMLTLYAMLPEKEKRLYAAIEAVKLPHGGQTYISQLLGCSRTTIQRGVEDLRHPDRLPSTRDRHPGGGRKRTLDTLEAIDEVFLKVIDDYIAGDPMNATIRWTNLSRPEIAARMQTEGVSISEKIVKQLLKKHHLKARKALKKKRSESLLTAMRNLKTLPV